MYLMHSETMPFFRKQILAPYLCTPLILFVFERKWYLGCKNFMFQQLDFVLRFKRYLKKFRSQNFLIEHITYQEA